MLLCITLIPLILTQIYVTLHYTDISDPNSDLCYAALISLILTQIYVEVPRARLTMELARIKESQDNISEAADVLQELQVREPLNFKGLLGWVSFKGEGGATASPYPLTSHNNPLTSHNNPLTSLYAYDGTPYPQYAYDGTPYPPYLSVCL